MITLLKDILTNPAFLITWIAVTLICLGIVIYDIAKKNNNMVGLMKWVWIFTVAYSGILGLAVYYYSGRKQIKCDSLWRKGFRSTCHCYSGCGAGEITGIFIAAGLLSLSTWWVAGITFFLAYVAGFAMTMGPLMQQGESFNEALKDAFYSETASITMMELAAIGTDIYLAGEATMGDTIFWSSLIFSLSVGFVAAFPVNVLLVHFGVKGGMMNPRDRRDENEK